jgi:hypothetical protein|tara:strand:+ start:369 stop:881 length:513 start_codon:yes stop_codon:yes gene_type:complete
MAILHQPESTSGGFDINETAPQGEFVATCLGIDDQMGVDRLKYGSMDEFEKVNVTRFLFGLKGEDGRLYKVQTFEMKISGSPKSKLFKFLSAWLGHAPRYGWDYDELRGQGAVITIAHQVSAKGTTYAKITGLRPVKSGLSDFTDKVLPVSAFEEGASGSLDEESDDCPF